MILRVECRDRFQCLACRVVWNIDSPFAEMNPCCQPLSGDGVVWLRKELVFQRQTPDSMEGSVRVRP